MECSDCGSTEEVTVYGVGQWGDRYTKAMCSMCWGFYVDESMDTRPSHGDADKIVNIPVTGSDEDGNEYFF